MLDVECAGCRGGGGLSCRKGMNGLGFQSATVKRKHPIRVFVPPQLLRRWQSCLFSGLESGGGLKGLGRLTEGLDVKTCRWPVRVSRA